MTRSWSARRRRSSGAMPRRRSILSSPPIPLVYFGDLAPLFAGLATALKPGGLFAFSLETCESESFRLGASMRFAHSQAYVERTATLTGLRPTFMGELSHPKLRLAATPPDWWACSRAPSSFRSFGPMLPGRTIGRKGGKELYATIQAGRRSRNDVRLASRKRQPVARADARRPDWSAYSRGGDSGFHRVRQARKHPRASGNPRAEV